MQLQEHDTVILTVDLPQHRLRAGDIATIVHIHENGAGFEIELTTLAGQTVAVVTVTADQVRPVEPSEVAAGGVAPTSVNPSTVPPRSLRSRCLLAIYPTNRLHQTTPDTPS